MVVTNANTVKNARLDAISATWGATPKLRIYTTPIPADVNAAVTGTMLVECTPAPAAASGGVKDMLGGAKNVTAAASGTAAYYRIWNSGATIAYEQGSVATSGSDLNIDNTSINSGQAVNFTTFTKTEPN